MKGKTRSLDVDMAKQSQPMQELAKQIKAMGLSYGDLTLYAAAAVFTSRTLMRERGEVVRSRHIGSISAKASEALRAAEKQKSHLRSIQSMGSEAMREQGSKFTDKVCDYVEQRLKQDHRLTTEHLVGEIAQLIAMDTSLIAQAKAQGQRWQDVVDLKFPRKNAKGDPYSRYYIKEKIQEARSARRFFDSLKKPTIPNDPAGGQEGKS